MARTHQRAFALIMAILFLATSVGTLGAVYVQYQQDQKLKQATEDLQSQLEDPTAINQENENMLQGTKLANFTPVQSVEALQKIDLVEGTGEVVQPGATVTAHYTGALAKDGTIFQSSYDMGNPIPFSLDGVIKGWTDGVPGMKVGGKRRLVIPAELAYGNSSPSANIPANSDLVFDIEIVKIGE